MAHEHSLFDKDRHFLIDPVTRSIKNQCGKTMLIKTDHNSEVFTFELPRYIDGHDMTFCNMNEVHYINLGTGNDKGETSKGLYQIEDLQAFKEDDQKVVFSWLIKGNATKYEGNLYFQIKFKCVNNNGEVEYLWNTLLNKELTIGEEISNSDYVEEFYADIIAQWKEDLFGIGDSLEQNLKNVSKAEQAKIEDKTQEGIQEIEDTMSTIPADYQELSDKVDELENKKAFYSVEFDSETRYLSFKDENGVDVYDPVYIEGGGGSGGGTASNTVVKLVNESGFTNATLASGKKTELTINFTSTEDGVPTGDGSCQVIVNGVTKATLNIKQGSTPIDVTDYLTAGTNTVRIKVTDVYGSYKILNFNITVIDLRITSTFDDSLTYSDVIQFKYVPYGTIEKTVHILVDNEEVYTKVVSASGKQTTVNLDAMSHGIHKIEAYITATLGTENLESEHLLYEAICIESGETDVLISSVYDVETVKQGTQVSIPYIVYNPSSLTSEISLIIANGDGEYSTKDITVDRNKQYWNVRDYPVGTTTFTIKCGDVEKTHTLTVTEAEVSTEPVTNDMELYLASKGRSNNEDNPNQWTHGDVSTTFNNVNWDSTGWINDKNGDTALRLSGGATAEISFQPFKEDWKTYGKTIEIEFAVRDVNNRAAVVISCMDNGIGFEMTPDTARLTSEQSTISCNYFEEEKVRVSFVVESKSEYRLLQVYLNGVLSAAKQYPANDNFQQTTPMNISIGSQYCGVDIYTIRSYSNALTFNEVINNYIADIPDVAEKTSVFEANNLYDEYGQLKYESVKEKIPVMTIIGDLPQSKGDKKDVAIKFEHNTDSSLSFEDNAEIDVQGTSSQWYIRKNYKEKMDKAHLHAVGQMPSRIFCTKADYAESTGTHNTQNANLVETLYSEKTPAQLVDERCRTTIFGYPIVIFHQETSTSTPTFVGKYNFNFDKGSVEVYGFDGSFDAESWEFLNNTSDQCNFLAPIGDKWSEDFEARYPEEHKDITRFKIMHDWVVSTKGNLTKFKNEFESHFDLHYTLIYYVYSSVMLMVDQRAKNMFLTYWAKTGKWQPWFYDSDTCLGINNEGHLVFDYYHEDIDTLDGANVYNGQNSTLWNNFRLAYADEIKATYQELRNKGKLTYEKIVEYFITNGSSKWSAAIYNEDSDYKYISMLRSDNDATNLYQVRGNGEEHLKYFVSNRLKYLDSKWYASDYAENYVTLRIYTPSEWEGVEPNADITITPFSNVYAGVRYKANGSLTQKRVAANEVTTFEAPNETFNDTETAIYGASEISSLGDLAPLYCGTINVSKASRLINLKIGDSTQGYVNTNLKTLSVGTNRLLKVIDVRNCPNLTEPLGLSGCPNIEEIYATGSGITGVELGRSGYLKKAYLPKVSNLTLRNQLYIETLSLEGYENVTTLNIENCPTLDELDLLQKCTNINRVRLTNVDWAFDDTSFLLGLVDKGVKGVDENGLNIDIPQISGTCHIPMLSGEEMARIKEHFPYLTVTYDSLTALMVYMNEDGTEELYRETLASGSNSTYGGVEQTKEDTAQYDYEFAGWSLEIGGEVEPNVQNNIELYRVVYAVFSATLKSYTINFYNGTTLLQTSQVPYGEMPVYSGIEPTPSTDYAFVGWTPELANVTGNADYQANFKYNKSLTRALVDKTITNVSSEVTTVGAYTFYGCDKLTSVDLPNATSIDDYAFEYCTNLRAVILRSNTLCSLYHARAFNNTPIVSEGYIYVPSALKDQYPNTEKWAVLTAERFRAIEDYPEICGGGN